MKVLLILIESWQREATVKLSLPAGSLCHWKSEHVTCCGSTITVESERIKSSCARAHWGFLAHVAEQLLTFNSWDSHLGNALTSCHPPISRHEDHGYCLSCSWKLGDRNTSSGTENCSPCSRGVPLGPGVAAAFIDPKLETIIPPGSLLIQQRFIET